MLISEQTVPATIERYEYKYRIPPSLVPAIQSAVRRYCVPDSASREGPYLISSLYFDSPDRLLYRQTRERVARRVKLRVRRYADGPFFLEVKRRHKAVVRKLRAAIDPALWPSIFVDPSVVTRHAFNAAQLRVINQFLNLSLQIRAEPAAVVRYSRDAYVSDVDGYGRVTFDGRLGGARPGGYAIPIDDRAGWMPLDDPTQMGLPMSGVILELKCTARVPLWMSDLVERFGLRPLGFSKYARALETVSRFPTSLGSLREPARWIAGGK